MSIELPVINVALASRLITDQFPEYAHLPIQEVEKQGHDNRTFRLGKELLIRMPTAPSYALKVPKEQELLPKLAKQLNISIPTPIKMGTPSTYYPYPFSIYRWLPGTSLNLLKANEIDQQQLAINLAQFLKQLQAINSVDGPPPGAHNGWRGAHISVYDQDARKQIAALTDIIDSKAALALWEKACTTRWQGPEVWLHGDLAVGNMLINLGKLTAIIDFGGTAIGDPACDLVIAWTYLTGKARKLFINSINLDPATWLRARAWALWKATYKLCQMQDKTSPDAIAQKAVIIEVINDAK